MYSNDLEMVFGILSAFERVMVFIFLYITARNVEKIEAMIKKYLEEKK